MVFQDPARSLNPTMRVGVADHRGDPTHRKVDQGEAHTQAVELLRLVRIPAPERRFHEYPHQLSGGMRQRVMIAIALACRPKLLIADEATTALDVTTQAQIMELLLELQAELGMSLIMISHDLGLAASYADEVVVMYAGKIVEQAQAKGAVRGRRDGQDAVHQGAARRDPAHRAGRAHPAARGQRAVRPTRPRCRPAARSRPRCAPRADDCLAKAPALAEHAPGTPGPAGTPARTESPHDRRLRDGGEAAAAFGARPGPGVRRPRGRRRQGRRRAGGLRRLVRHHAGRDARHRRRDRVRQVDPRPRGTAGAPAQVRARCRSAAPS